MGNRSVMLGKAIDIETEAGVSKFVEPLTIEERLSVLEAKIESLIQNRAERREEERIDPQPSPGVNKDGIPINLNFIGITRGVPYVLTVLPDAYYVGNRPYPSLSAAAKAVSGVRRSGWTFWKLPNGRTAKEVFKN